MTTREKLEIITRGLRQDLEMAEAFRDEDMAAHYRQQLERVAATLQARQGVR